MTGKEKSYLDILESALKKLWRKHQTPKIIKALHTEVVVEPHPFVRGHLNPQMAEFLISLYLHNVKADPLHNGTVEVGDGVLRIKDKDDKLIAETTSTKLIREYLG